MGILIRPLLKAFLACAAMFALTIAVMPKPHLLDETSFSPCYVDRNGKLLRLGLADDDRYRVYVPMEKISPVFSRARRVQPDSVDARRLVRCAR
jgi:penicillin-binding protein 1C